MKILVQRVSSANVKIEQKIVGEIEYGYMILVSFCKNDTTQIVDKMIDKLLKLRICSDENGKLNLSILDIKGEILSISQFTLYASLKKGNRPSFTDSLAAEQASKLYDYVNQQLAQVLNVETGQFGADMQVELVNDGPLTIMMDSSEIIK